MCNVSSLRQLTLSNKGNSSGTAKDGRRKSWEVILLRIVSTAVGVLSLRGQTEEISGLWECIQAEKVTEEEWQLKALEHG